MNKSNQSVSVANGVSTDPDARVNYEFGLVLGVNEFRQEQDYFLQKDYLYNRELHGYGTVSGLQVIAERTPAKDVRITVKPGLALDQFGRSVIVRSDQCASLRAWLTKRQSEIADHPADDRGYVHVYIVANYNECLDTPVPVAGQLCNAGNGNAVPSRIRDYPTIEFRWDPPAMPAWDAARTFAQLLTNVRILPECKDDEQDIIKQVRQIGQSNLVRRTWSLPAETASKALDRIFTVWVTEVRPKLVPNLLDPGANNEISEAGILLARLDFMLGDSSQNENGTPAIAHFQHPKNDNRPYLLHAQLIDELLLLGGHERKVRSRGAALVVQEFATLSVYNAHSLHVWVHHPRKLLFSAGNGNWSNQLELKCDDQPLAIANVKTADVPGLSNLFHIEVNSDREKTNSSALVAPGSRIELVFKTNNIAVEWGEDDEENDENPLEEAVEEEIEEVLATNEEEAEYEEGSDFTLTKSIDDLRLDYVGYKRDKNTITVYTFDDGRGGLSVPIQPFVTITVTDTYKLAGSGAFVVSFELWFHLTPDHTHPPVGVSFDSNPFFEVFQESSEPSDPHHSTRIEEVTVKLRHRNIFEGTLTPPGTMSNKHVHHLIFKFPLDKNPVHTADGRSYPSLGAYMWSIGRQFEGFNGKDAIITYVRVFREKGF